jgi:hypothetical protein
MSSYPDSDLFDENPLDILSETLEDEIKDDLDEVSLLEATVPQRRMVLPVSEDAGESKDSGGTPSIESPSNSPLPPWGTESSPVGQVSSPPPLRREGSTPTTPFAPTQDDLDQYTYKEVIVDKNGLPRHAGSDTQEGLFVRGFKKAAEQSLFLFCKAVLNRHFLTDSLHRPVCEFLQKVPPFRKLVLMPREHAKTAIVSGGLPLHIIIQPAETNIYFPGMEGSECRIMLAGENMRMAKKNLRVLEEVHSGNKLFRALWPERVWEAPRRESKLWNQEALIFPRQNEWPDPTIWAIGVDGAVTGSRPNVMIKDDLVSVEAANSDVVMDTAIDWHKASRALLDRYEVSTGLQSLEFIIGTRWAVFDLYSYIIDNDPSVEVISEEFHQIIRNGKILWPEKHTEESIAQLRSEHGSMFYLLYLNSAADPNLTDFDLDLVREFKIIDDHIVFEEDARDARLVELFNKKSDSPAPPSVPSGTRLTPDLMRDMFARREYFRARRD